MLEVAGLAGAVLLLVAVARYTPLDYALSTLFYDPGTSSFPLRHSPFWTAVMHSGLKYLSIALWLGLLLWWLLQARRSRHAPLREAAGFTLLIAPLSALAVSVLRSLSDHSCPWELAVYGGGADYFRFFDAVPAAPGSGRCAPSGHASAGFMWFAGYVAARRVGPRAARLALALALCLGTLTGLTQIVRGAHFVSHVLLTAWVCYAVAWAGDLGRRSFSQWQRPIKTAGKR